MKAKSDMEANANKIICENQCIRGTTVHIVGRLPVERTPKINAKHIKRVPINKRVGNAWDLCSTAGEVDNLMAIQTWTSTKAEDPDVEGGVTCINMFLTITLDLG